MRAPIGFGEKHQVGNRRVRIGPEFGVRRFKVSHVLAPYTFENSVELQHRHVAAHAVAMSGDFAKLTDERGAHCE